MAKTGVAALADQLKVFCDPTRLAIFDLLMQGVQCNCEIGNHLDIPMNLISHHLHVLRDAGLVDVRRDATDARWIYYSINQPALNRLRKQLNAFLDPQRILPRCTECGPSAISEGALEKIGS